jgi:thiol:disulfide interchange protein DsbA
MRFYRLFFQYRLIWTVVLALIGIGIMIFYAACNTACSYLRGDIFGIDLKYIGVGYMGLIILLAILKQADLIRMLVSAGIGVEIFLVSFQFKENIFCPYCLSFGVMVFLMYIINYERTSMRNKWYQKMVYIFGDAKIPFLKDQHLPMLLMMLVGYIFVCLSFSGSATPAYAGENSVIPSYGKGAWELIVFTDYFCPPCQSAEKDLGPEIERLLKRGDIKITFVDYPGHKHSALYSKYFLYAAGAGKDYQNAVRARHVLFSLAAQKNIDQEPLLSTALASRNIAMKTIDPKPVYKEWAATIKRYEIDQTPTCLLRFSSTYTKKYTDSENIRTKLIPELQKRFPAAK